MLLNQQTLNGIGAGTITAAYRRWKRPTVKAGGTLTTAIGVLAIDSVKPVTLKSITNRQARAAGYDTAEQLVRELRKRTDGTFYEVTFHLAGEDPRIALRNQSRLSKEELDDLRQRLARLDRASRTGEWTARYLKLISQKPAIRAPDLADRIGIDTVAFKRNVRKLKALGLTESLKVGYRLSPRGNALLEKV